MDGSLILKEINNRINKFEIEYLILMKDDNKHTITHQISDLKSRCSELYDLRRWINEEGRWKQEEIEENKDFI